MAIIWCGGEDIDFPNGVNATTVDTNSYHYHTSYARCAVLTPNGNTYNYSNAFSGITSCWVSLRNTFDNYGNDSGPWCVLGVGGVSGGNSYFLGIRAYGGLTSGLYYKLSTYSAGTWTDVGTNTGARVSGLIKLDLQVTGYGSGAATVTLYANGTSVASYSGALSLTATTITNVFLGSNVGGSGNSYISEVIVADQDTRSFSLVTLAPNANGTTQNWSNGAYTNINSVALNDANPTYTNTTGQDEQVNLIDLPSGTFSVLAVKTTARAMATADAAINHLQVGVNNGGTVAVGSSHALSTAFASYEDLFATDPTTGTTWASTAMNGLQLDLRSA